MGVDIHMHIMTKDGQILKHDIFEGKDSEWFDNISRDGYCYDDDYDDFPFCEPPIVPQTIKDEYEKLDGYNLCCVSVTDFSDWFSEYKPHYKAGWVTTYDKWRMDKKHYIPEELPIRKPDDGDDWEFVEYINKYDNSYWLYRFLGENFYADLSLGDKINDIYIIYFFDR